MYTNLSSYFCTLEANHKSKSKYTWNDEWIWLYTLFFMDSKNYDKKVLHRKDTDFIRNFIKSLIYKQTRYRYMACMPVCVCVNACVRARVNVVAFKFKYNPELEMNQKFNIFAILPSLPKTNTFLEQWIKHHSPNHICLRYILRLATN